MTLLGCVWAQRGEASDDFGDSAHLALAGYLFLMFIAAQSELSIPPWPMLAVLAVLTLAFGVATLVLRKPSLHIAAIMASQVVLAVWAGVARVPPWPNTALVCTLAVVGFAILWIRFGGSEPFVGAALMGIFAAHGVAIIAGASSTVPLFGTLLATHGLLLAVMLVLAGKSRNHAVTLLSVPVLAAATMLARTATPGQLFLFALIPYALYILYPLVLGGRLGKAMEPHLAAIAASAAFFFFARNSMTEAGYGDVIGILPVAQAAILLVLLIRLVRSEPAEERMLARLAFVAGAALAFITVAIPLQLEKEWITIAWALEAAALVWLFTRIPHRGLLAWSAALFAVVFVRLVFNPAVFSYHEQATRPILNWYLYTYVVSAAAFYFAAWRLPRTETLFVRAASACGTVLLFFVVNIEIADFYSTGPTLTFNFFSSSLAQDLTYTMAWAIFALAMLIAGLVLQTRAARVAAIVLLLVTVLKCFLHDLNRLGGLYRVVSLLGLAVCLVAVGLLLQKFALTKRTVAEEAMP